MPKLKQIENIRLYLPSTENEANEADRGWVDIKGRLLLSDASGLQSIDNDADRGFAMLQSAIVDWNFTDENGTPVDPTMTWINVLPTEDIAFLLAKVGEIAQESFKGLTNPEKKDSSLPSPEVAQVPTITPLTS